MIYEQPTIYKCGLSEKDVKEIINKSYNFSYTILPKYQNKIGPFDMSTTIKPNIYIADIKGSFLVTTSFHPTYNSSDGGGDNDWPMIAYADVDPELIENSGPYFSLFGSPSQVNYQFTMRKETGKLEFRVPSGVNMTTNWYTLSSGFVIK